MKGLRRAQCASIGRLNIDVDSIQICREVPAVDRQHIDHSHAIDLEQHLLPLAG
jgi:hypothetical protein